MLLLAAVVRIAVFLALIVWPLPNETGQLVSPILVQSGIDYEFYDSVRQKLFHGESSSIAESFADFFSGASAASMFVSAPMLPALL